MAVSVVVRAVAVAAVGDGVLGARAVLLGPVGVLLHVAGRLRSEFRSMFFNRKLSIRFFESNI